VLPSPCGHAVACSFLGSLPFLTQTTAKGFQKIQGRKYFGWLKDVLEARFVRTAPKFIFLLLSFCPLYQYLCSILRKKSYTTHPPRASIIASTPQKL
jgi:hypothetical protein